MPLFDTTIPAELLTGMRSARGAIGRGELVVIPTDTVYGVAADAFSAAAVQRLLDAKGRDRSAPPPVLVPGIPTLDALAETVPDAVRALVAEFWPGGLTVILRARATLDWDLGDTRGTVALRMPSDTIALELLSDTGPLAVSSANRTGEPAATTAAEAEAMLGDSVAVYLDGGRVGAAYPGAEERSGSTIVDATSLGTAAPEGAVGKLRIVRHGVIPDAEIIRIVGADTCA
jgi:tRNA threonylcarbamoyl adenosine modification protein (Sua5/YciO/YrdC/YwlC family)